MGGGGTRSSSQPSTLHSKTKSNKMVWQSLINVGSLKGALRKLREINWLYANIDFCCCFPTLFPSDRFGESHPRDIHISPSEIVKSHLLNKDGRYRKDDQYVFYLLWQKEMRELQAGVYNLLKGTRQHAMPVGQFIDRISCSDDEVEGNLSTIFQSVRGSKQYWFRRNSELLCMLRKYGSPTFFLTLSCAEYDSPEIDSYLKKVNTVNASYPIAKLCYVN